MIFLFDSVLVYCFVSIYFMYYPDILFLCFNEALVTYILIFQNFQTKHKMIRTLMDV